MTVRTDEIKEIAVNELATLDEQRTRKPAVPWTHRARVERRFKKILSSRALYKSIKTIITNPDHEHFPKVLQILLDRGVGPVKQEVVMEGGIGAGPTALPPIVQTRETISKIYNEQGELIKTIGHRQVKITGLPPGKPEEIPEAEFSVEESGVLKP